MYILFIVLVAGGPIIAVVFAASVLGFRVPQMHYATAVDTLDNNFVKAKRLHVQEAAVFCNADTEFSTNSKLSSMAYGSSWRQVLGVPLNEYRRSVAHQAYRALARENHPDINGSNEAMQRVNDAWRQAKKELVLK
jgi:hypothetical protein